MSQRWRKKKKKNKTQMKVSALFSVYLGSYRTDINCCTDSDVEEVIYSDSDVEEQDSMSSIPYYCPQLRVESQPMLIETWFCFKRNLYMVVFQ
ncbi:hypothetical protein C5167_014489 [Papaver somniferum]|uniref:Uncharacterized protein n=1 Tax=Papaver somniferum TaxID=3469 RepID=A0A4Y7J6F9_PAPSO|nr:hypothetical protein C5167_014489 [Papaver somniferum]